VKIEFLKLAKLEFDEAIKYYENESIYAIANHFKEPNQYLKRFK